MTLLALITLTAIGLRWPQLGDSFWLDELHTAWTVAGKLGEVAPRAAIGNQSPLYFYLVWLSQHFLGGNEIALRLPSLIAGVMLIPACYWIVRRWSGSATGGLAAAALATIDPHCLYYSLEARPYAMVQLAAVAQLHTFRLTMHNPCLKHRCGWIGLSAVLFYLHYTAVLIVPAELALCFFIGRNRSSEKPYHWRNLGCDCAVLAVLLLPATWHLLQIGLRRENWWLLVTPPRVSDAWRMFPLGVYLTIPVAGQYAAALWRRIRGGVTFSHEQSRWTALLLTMLWLVVPLSIAFFLTQWEVAALWMRRYLIASAVAPIVLGGLLCGAVRPLPLRVITAVFTCLVAVYWIGPSCSSFAVGNVVHRSEQNWRSAVAELRESSEGADWPLLVRSGLIEANALPAENDSRWRDYYLLPVRGFYSPGERKTVIPLATTQPGKISLEDLRQLKGQRGLWILTPGNQATADSVRKQVQRSLQRVQITVSASTQKSHGSVWLIRLQLEAKRKPIGQQPKPQGLGFALPISFAQAMLKILRSWANTMCQPTFFDYDKTPVEGSRTPVSCGNSRVRIVQTWLVAQSRSCLTRWQSAGRSFLDT